MMEFGPRDGVPGPAGGGIASIDKRAARRERTPFLKPSGIRS